MVIGSRGSTFFRACTILINALVGSFTLPYIISILYLYPNGCDVVLLVSLKVLIPYSLIFLTGPDMILISKV